MCSSAFICGNSPHLRQLPASAATPRICGNSPHLRQLIIELIENTVALAYNPRAMYLRTMLATVFVLAAAGFATEAHAQQPDEFAGQARPLITEDVELIRPGTIRAQAGIAFLQDQDFSLSGLNGDLTRSASSVST